MLLFARSHITLCTDRVPREDGLRQERTAEEILKRLARQPGVVLADEVGMGKTFVALAVAASILLDRACKGTVIVMVPPSLRDKWPKDWAVFRDKCLQGQAARQFRHEQADSGVEFLRKLNEKPHLLFLTHGACIAPSPTGTPSWRSSSGPSRVAHLWRSSAITSQSSLPACYK